MEVRALFIRVVQWLNPDRDPPRVITAKDASAQLSSIMSLRLRSPVRRGGPMNTIPVYRQNGELTYP